MNNKVNFIKSSKKVDLLNELVNTQIARKNQYRDNQIVFLCGWHSLLCEEAYNKWVDNLEENVNTVATDGDLNKFRNLDMLGYNKKVMEDVIDYADNSLSTYSQSVLLSVMGADSYLSRQNDPSPDSPIPAVTL